MADKTLYLLDHVGAVIAVKYIDNGDGTYSPSQGGSGGAGSSVSTGDVASGATDSGNPVKIGYVYNTSPPTVTNGQRVNAQADSTGGSIVNLKPLSSAFDSISAVQGSSPFAVGGVDELAASQTFTNDTHGNQIAIASVALYPAIAANNPSGAVSTVTLTFPNLTAAGVTFDTQFATIIVENRLTTQTINALTLRFTDLINVNNATIDYQVPAVSLASGTGAGSVGIFRIPITAGKTKTVSLIIGFAAGVSAGTVSAQLVLSAAQQPIPVTSQAQGNPAAITVNTAVSVIAANALTLLRLNLTSLIVTNSHASTGTLVTFTAGSGGTVLVQGYAAPVGGGFVLSWPRDNPLSLPVNTALSAICGTASANVYISASGYWSA